MQTICAYEIAYLTTSDFCGLFTADEWAGFENTLDIACKLLFRYLGYTFDFNLEIERLNSSQGKARVNT